MNRIVQAVLGGLVSASVGIAPTVLAAGPAKGPGPRPSAAPVRAAATPSSGMRTGKVIKSIDVGTYSYVQVQTEKEKVWVAAPRIKVDPGQVITFSTGLPMENYHSKTLDRTFDVVYFVATLHVAGSDKEVPQIRADPSSAAIARAHGGRKPHAKASVTAVDASGVTRLAGGQTIREIQDRKKDLAGQEISVRGKVTKFTSGVMKRNWIHLRDATSRAGDSGDLVVTTAQETEIGATIQVHGKVVLDQEFGFGYHFPVLIENASLTVE